MSDRRELIVKIEAQTAEIDKAFRNIARAYVAALRPALDALDRFARHIERAQPRRPRRAGRKPLARRPW